jgi:hypothetical protein
MLAFLEGGERVPTEPTVAPAVPLPRVTELASAEGPRRRSRAWRGRAAANAGL